MAPPLLNGKPSATSATTTVLHIKSSGEFVSNFVPPDYIVDGVLQEGFLYSLTGQTGSGKTSIMLRLAASIATGQQFAGRETKQRRVLYLAAENPLDVQMRWIALAQHVDFLPAEAEVFFVEGVFRLSETPSVLRAEAEKLGGEFGLVVVDTGPVFYEGTDENNRTEQGRHAVIMRELITLIPGTPCVIVNCHPVKNADPDNLLPAGGGNFLNSVDGNLTLAKTESACELHWAGKFRGVEFMPLNFMLKTVTHQDLKDSRGKLIPTVISVWISEQGKEELTAYRNAVDRQALEIISSNSRVTQVELAAHLGWKVHSGQPNKVRAHRLFKTLEKRKLIKPVGLGHQLTPSGTRSYFLSGYTKGVVTHQSYTPCPCNFFVTGRKKRLLKQWVRQARVVFRRR